MKKKPTEQEVAIRIARWVQELRRLSGNGKYAVTTREWNERRLADIAAANTVQDYISWGELCRLAGYEIEPRGARQMRVMAQRTEQRETAVIAATAAEQRAMRSVLDAVKREWPLSGEERRVETFEVRGWLTPGNVATVRVTRIYVGLR